MSRNDLNMEDLFRSRLESYSADPSPGLWQKVYTKIRWKQFLRFNLKAFNIYYLASAISIAGIGSFALFSGSPAPMKEQPLQVRPESRTNIPSETADFNLGNDKIISNETEKQGSPEQENGVNNRKGKINRRNSSKVSPEPAVKETKKSSTVPVKSEITEPLIQKTEPVSIKADFEADRLSGCSPLAVIFRNRSENAVRYNWFFSDGGGSAEENPSYVFDEPGEYPVTLKIIGEDGSEYTAQKTIQVFESPKALFELDGTADLMNNQTVYFYNYSRDAEYFEWDFGDDQRSNLAEPIHYYEQPGSYNVRLKVWTESGCYDSLVIQNAFTGPESEIHFPNAFAPNMSGPSGGYYDMNDVQNSVFHPVISGELIEYQLKIFNRQGVQIFESNDLAYGWDGYYQEKLAAQNVYIWKVRGKFSNGKTFVKSGDVTLIKQH